MPHDYSCWATHFKPATRPLSPSLIRAHRHIFHKVKVTNSKNAYTILPTCAQHILTLTCRAESDYNCLFSPHVRVYTYVFVIVFNVKRSFYNLSKRFSSFFTLVRQIWDQLVMSVTDDRTKLCGQWNSITIWSIFILSAFFTCDCLFCVVFMKNFLVNWVLVFCCRPCDNNFFISLPVFCRKCR